MLKKSTFREIKNSLGRYLAILAIVALGVGFFAGLKVTQEAMVTTTGNYLNRQNLFDYQILSTLGFEEEDVKTMSDADGVKAAEGAVSTDALYHFDGEENDSVMMFHSLPSDINLLILKDGNLPTEPNQCVVDHSLISSEDIGKKIVVSRQNDEDTRDMFQYKTYTITGTVVSPVYLNFERGTTSLGNGTVSGFAYLPIDGFDTDYFTEIYLDLDAEGTIYSSQYEDTIEKAEAGLQDTADLCAQRRYDSIREDALEELEEGQQEYDENYAKYLTEKADAEDELADAKKELEDGQAEIDKNEKTLNDKEADLTTKKIRPDRKEADPLIEQKRFRNKRGRTSKWTERSRIRPNPISRISCRI